MVLISATHISHRFYAIALLGNLYQIVYLRIFSLVPRVSLMPLIFSQDYKMKRHPS